MTPTIQEEDEEGEEEEEEEEEEEGESEAEETQEKEISADSEGEACGKDTSPKLEPPSKPKARLGHPYLDRAQRLGRRWREGWCWKGPRLCGHGSVLFRGKTW